MAERIPFTERKTPWRGLLDLASGCYPRFLFGGGLGSWLPVFHFHEASREYLEPYLLYLAENRYRTVTSDAIAKFVRQGVHPGKRAVAICFDDAWTSLWTVVAPLLKKYGLQAITYAIPGRVVDSEKLRPTLDDPGWEPESFDRSAVPFATWGELRALHASGVVDIQAHTFWHGMVFSESEIQGFVQPGFHRHPHLYPMIRDGNGDRFLSPNDLGAPIYAQRSRMSDALRCDNPQAREACMKYVRENGGKEFFQRSGWEIELRHVAAKGQGTRETQEERNAAILAELISARETLNSQLKTDTVRHMCFPWAVCGDAAERAAEKAGYETAFGDRMFGGRSVRAGDPPYRLMRLKHNYIYCLPGTRRQTIFTVGRKLLK
jgi:peptidoglycan/xylan/chitin deacetylase (PgdA/CDA1 family)